LTLSLRFPLPLALALALAALLSACGGGGGGGAEGTTAAAAVPVVTIASIVPAADMGWTTALERPLRLSVLDVDGRPAVGAGVRVFTLSRTSPQDGETLDAPVPLSLLDSAATDAAGQVLLTLRGPAHLDEVLVVATRGDQQGQRAVALGAAGQGVQLTLGR
jgi:hypothetical protein